MIPFVVTWPEPIVDPCAVAASAVAGANSRITTDTTPTAALRTILRRRDCELALSIQPTLSIDLPASALSPTINQVDTGRAVYRSAPSAIPVDARDEGPDGDPPGPGRRHDRIVTMSQALRAGPTAAGGPTRGSHLRFFGLGITVVGTDLPDFRFLFGPHVTAPGRADLLVEITTSGPLAAAGGRAGARAVRELQVRRSDGLPLLRRPLHGWSNVPPPFPRFAAMFGRCAVTPAAVLCRGGTSIALVGHALTERSPIAVALALRSWRIVSPQLLVVDRRTGRAMPFATPLEVPVNDNSGNGDSGNDNSGNDNSGNDNSGNDNVTTWSPAVVDFAGAGHPATQLRRSRSSPVTGQVLLIRPESVGELVPVETTVEPPTVIRLCRGAHRQLRLTDGDQWAPRWSAGPEPARLRTRCLELPDSGLADEAAHHLDEKLTPHAGEDISCRDGRRIGPVSRAGSIA